ncbi:Ig-like domain (group 2) [Prevotellaceae bacterium MN60]|nr:Ig-like domain (group 2) [Prevotellaceae bacterium MN60]
MKEKKMILSLRGKWFISLLMLLLMSVGVQAENTIVVAGVTVTTDNASDVLGNGTVSFDLSTNTLTLNGATITLSSSSPHAVSSSITNLKVNLIGENVINASDAFHPVFHFLTEGSTGKLTFETERGEDGSYGSLMVNGIYQASYFQESYPIQNQFKTEEVDGWHMEEVGDVSSEVKYIKIYYVEYYDLWVKGERLSTENRSSIAEGFSLDEETNTLTLNNAEIDMSDISDCYVIESSIANLKVKLMGYNSITIGEGSDFPYAFGYRGEETTAQLTFETEKNEYDIFGTLNVSGIQDVENLANGYQITNTLQDKTAETTGWEYETQSGNYKSVSLRYVEYYPLWMGNAHINSNSLSPASGGTVYIPESHTLHLEGYGYSDAIRSEMSELIIEVAGSNSLSKISYTGTGNGRLVFRAAEESWSANTISLNSNDGVIVGFNEVVINEPLRVVTPAETPATWTSEIKSAVISDDMFVSVSGVRVTNANAADVLGDGKVSFDLAKNALTLNGATIGGNVVNPDGPTMEAPGIEYIGVADFTIKLIGENTVAGMGDCEAIRYNGVGQDAPKLIFDKGDDNTCSLQMNAGESKSAIAGFSAIQGVWSLGATDNGLAIIAEDAVRYSAENGLEMETLVNYTVNYVTLSSTLIASYYGLTISGVPVYEGNKANIAGKGINGNGTASFNSETNTLTLNNINLNSDNSQNDGDISIVTSLAQLSINLIGENQTYAIKTTNSNGTLTFKSAEENKATARLSFWYSANPQLVGFGEGKVTYEDGLCLRNDASNSSFPKIVALHVPKVVTEENERGLYYTDHEFTFSLDEAVDGFDIYYANMLGGDPVKTTNGKFTLGTGRYLLRVYPIYPGMDTEPSRNWQFSSEISAKVIAKPTFTVADGTYNEPKNVKLENIPEQGADAESYPQVWYYLNDVKNDSVRYDATKGIDVTESCKVSVYVLDEDSSRVIKSEPVEAQYVIRQDAGLAFTAEEAEYTIGGENNQELPTLANTNNVAVTYSSSNETVATVDTDGKVTIVGMGETTIKAASQQTDELLAGEATYVLKVYKDINYSSITVTLSELTYNGQPQTPTVTVKDGETVLTAAVNYLVVAPEAGNTNAVDATAANAPIVTINANTDAEVNYYVGERQVKFGIAPKALTDEMVTLSKTSFEYSGENQKPTVTVADGELMTTNDYTITNEGGVEVGEYTVKVVAKNNYTGMVEKNFEIVTRTLEIGKDVNFVEGQKWASYYTTTEDLVLPEGLMAYIVTATSADAVAVKAINYVPKNVAVLIEKASTTTTDNTSAEGNLLQGTASATNVSDIAGNAYVLYNNGFTRATSGQIPAHRAYLVLAEPAGARLAIFDEETTGMEAVSRDKVATYENIYDLQGRKISNGQWSMVNGQLKKGLYIVNGKKIVVK